MLDRSLFVRTSLYVAAFALATTEPAISQAPANPGKPMEYVGIGTTMLSANGYSSNAVNGTFGIALTQLYMTVTGNLFTKGTTTLDDEFQAYYLFQHVNDPGQRSRAGLGIGGGIWYPQVGNTSLMLSLGGFYAASGSHLGAHFMAGYILPSAGTTGVLAIRIGGQFTWH